MSAAPVALANTVAPELVGVWIDTSSNSRIEIEAEGTPVELSRIQKRVCGTILAIPSIRHLLTYQRTSTMVCLLWTLRRPLTRDV